MDVKAACMNGVARVLLAAAVCVALCAGASLGAVPAAYAADSASACLMATSSGPTVSVQATSVAAGKSKTTSKAKKAKKAKALSWKKCLARVRGVSRTQDLKLSNRVSGYKVSYTRWKAVQKAIRSCHAHGFGVGFVMVDCNTGMTVTYNQDCPFYGSSTIKGLYATYLFQSCLEKKRYPYKRLKSQMAKVIVKSDNDAYVRLRSHYGSQKGFRAWLNGANVGSLGIWAHLTPRTLAKAWTRIYGYSKSKGRYVKAWKSLFGRSSRSFIRDELGSMRTVYSKPGWSPSWYYPQEKGPTTNDAGVVYDRHGRQYVLVILSRQDSEKTRAPLRQLARALDALHMSMPKSR